MLVGELIKVLEVLDLGAEVGVAPVSRVSGWVSGLTTRVGRGPNGIVVLELREETMHSTEVDVDWVQK